MDIYFDRWDDGMREIGQHVTRLEHEVRQPRLAIEADGPADTTKTRERTEGAATTVQAMRGDYFSARRVEPGPTNSTSFGIKAKPPALPCRDDSVVECGAAAFESCLPSMEMRPSTAAGGLVPTGDASKASETTLNEPPLRFCSTEETNLKAKNSWTSVPFALYDSSSVFQERNRLLLHTAGGSLTQNPGKIGPLIQAVLEVTSAPARFWNRGARWFVARIYGLGQLAGDELQCFFGRDTLALWKKGWF